jgi:hypothetical protein
MDGYSPSSKYLASLKKNIRSKNYAQWFYSLPDEHIEYFLLYGLKPFLNQFGYTLGFSDKDMISYIKRWAFNIVNKDELKFVLWSHNGGDEEFEWFNHIISIDEWLKLCSSWDASEFLDDSDAGVKQSLDLQWFIWQCISLDLSKQHQCWIDINIDLEEEDHWIYDEAQAYGGDRRTY